MTQTKFKIQQQSWNDRQTVEWSDKLVRLSISPTVRLSVSLYHSVCLSLLAVLLYLSICHLVFLRPRLVEREVAPRPIINRSERQGKRRLTEENSGFDFELF